MAVPPRKGVRATLFPSPLAPRRVEKRALFDFSAVSAPLPGSELLIAFPWIAGKVWPGQSKLRWALADRAAEGDGRVRPAEGSRCLGCIRGAARGWRHQAQVANELSNKRFYIAFTGRHGNALSLKYLFRLVKSKNKLNTNRMRRNLCAIFLKFRTSV